MASIGDLFIELGVKADTKTLNKVGQSVKTLRTNLLLLGGAFTGAVVGLDRFVNSALKGVVALQNINAQTGLSIEKLQKFQQAGQLSNLALSADQIAQSIGNVQKNLANIKIGQGDIAPFQLLGIDVAGQDAFGVIDQLRDSIQGIDPAVATNLISGIGLSPDFINILKLSREEFDALSDNVFLSAKQRADIDRVGTSIKALGLRFKALKDQAVAKLAPELDKLVKQFFKWIKDNGDKIIQTITKISRAFARFAQAIGNAFSIASRFIESIAGMQNGILILASAFGFLALSMSPFLAGLAAIILLLDDIAVFKRGGDSVIGELIKAFDELPDFAKILGGAAALAGIAKLTTAITGLGGAATSLLGPLGKIAILGVTIAGAKKLGEKGGEALSKTSVGQGIAGALIKIQDFFTGNKPVEFTTPSGPPQLLGGGNATINNNIVINGIQDPTGVRNEVERVLTPITQESLNRAQAAQGNGVK